MPLRRGLVEAASNSNNWARIGLKRDPPPNLIWIPLHPKPGTDGRIILEILDDSIRATHSCPTVDSLESLIRPATSRDAFFENVRNKNPLPTAENPLRLVPAISWSTRRTLISDFICALDAPSDNGRFTSIWIRAFTGGGVPVSTNTPSTLISRVTP